MNPRLLIGLAVVVAILAIAGVTALGGRGGTGRTESAQRPGAAATQAPAAEVRPPPGCPATVTKLRYSRAKVAEFDHAVWCARYRATPNSSVNQFVGAP
jgi:hypothetical protein